MFHGVRDEAAPQRVVDNRVLGDGAALQRQRPTVQGRRVTVQWHVTHGGDAACGRGRCAAEEALPLGTARLIEVDVRVDEPRQDVETAGVDHCVGTGRRIGWKDRRNAAIFDEDVSLTDRKLVDQSPAPDQQSAHRPSTFSTAESTRLAASRRASAPSKPRRQACGPTRVT